MRHLLTLATAGLGLALAGPAAAQQDFPSKPIRLVVGYGAGGTTDILARVIADKLSGVVKQSIVVENRTGAAGGIAAATVARAPADGYTLFMGTVASHGINPALYKKLEYDPVADFSPVALVATIPLVLVVNNQLPVKDVPELIALAKRKPGELNYSSGGNGSPVHLAGELFAHTAGLQLTHVPYRSGAQGNASVIGGETQLSFALLPAIMPQLQANQVRPLALTVKDRSAVLPDVKPLPEYKGFEKYSVNSWNAVFAPKGTPAGIIAKLDTAIAKALQDPDLKARFAAAGADPTFSDAKELDGFVKEELAKWKAVVTQAKIELE
ncbi:Tripartite tricarboxylate transporter family receptor [Pigmentiphaga humi]|uniref:Tripartite tricarboxylate transporter family receptor n=1 Tax=Pigmentiphaga humi TaxID=2478468 RepID=A0A3P4AY52_9BURK|nr:tripartite tricarboxylate transporter substrate binding protein [Pigmentiphaga humi]VCU68358.1 Tripartite tricarboxylate transporter family receptor [Pigmentiphaga humi]